ncbi:dTDP-glucose 4,6-dehydratase [Thalassobacillus pellis]|uniref:dTDP-glucose 4,6-dehydratase n=1 Tax=Thalassobacillus pellis TaxID=748008 RepID=UPI00195F8F97|nr:dTDP-glucose 4,6-dehydratase [Thalassobacillus pellis]MBM7553803.1 dTDP-glucose 4,6-dehydratase [Thalassobacillus pellis]
MNKEKKTILVTGGAGFIGSNFVTYFLRKYPSYEVVTIDKLTYAGSLENLTEAREFENHHFIQGDIADEKFVKKIFSTYDIHGIIHFAAESHVDKSIDNARPFIMTNVLGTVNLLEAARHDWDEKGELTDRRFHHISTDEVYGSLPETGKFTESTPYDPRNPYSASKASANLLVNSYQNTYGMNTVISSSSNNYGPRQHEEKLIPTIIRKALEKSAIPIYGDGKNVRDWLYVGDHCRALDMVFHYGKRGESYNIGGGNEQTNIDLATIICDHLDERLSTNVNTGSCRDLITFVKDRPGHDLRYAVDDTKIRQSLGWYPEKKFEDGLRETVDWYVKKWQPLAR